MRKGKVIGPIGSDAFQSEQVLRFAATSANATEKNPLVLGNVEFWIGTGPWEGVLTYSIPTYSWDKDAIRDALISYLADKMDGLKTYLHIPIAPSNMRGGISDPNYAANFVGGKEFWR